MKTATKRVLPADVYDALELSALVFGGIGSGAFAKYGPKSLGVCTLNTDAIPLCPIGHLSFVSGMSPLNEAACVMARSGITADVSDRAVRIANRNRDTRISFRRWCAALGVERGA